MSTHSSRRVVITGVGVVSPIGIGTESFWNSLISGSSGIEVRPQFIGTEIPIRLVAQVKDFDPRDHIPIRKAIKIMCGPIQYACASAVMAWNQAKLPEASIDPEKIGTLFGTETFFADPLEVADVFHHCTVEKNYRHEKWGEFAIRKIQPLWMLKYLPNMSASHISIMFDARGHSNSICQGEVSGLIAMIEAANVIQRGWCDVMLVGGAGSMCELSSMLYRGNNLSRRYNHEPTRASRPFDLHRDGMVAGEGAAALVLETEEHAARRGVEPLARLAGWSQTFAGCPSVKLSDAIQNGFLAALEHAKLEPHRIGSINAHASGSIVVDAAEAQAISSVFGEIPVVANKGNFGNLGPGTSSVETVASVLSLHHRQLPPTINCDHYDPACPVRVSNSSTPWPANESILKSSISETGQLATVILVKD
jgi:3-oxoacyl-[acyl-carrier-protein] synthase II